jgi:Protein of unknown function (DUF3987)
MMDVPYHVDGNGHSDPRWPSLDAASFASTLIIADSPMVMALIEEGLQARVRVTTARPTWAVAAKLDVSGIETIILLCEEVRDSARWAGLSRGWIASGLEVYRAVGTWSAWASQGDDEAAQSALDAAELIEPCELIGPDLSLLSPHRIPPPPMPLGGFGELAPWLNAAARAKGAPVDYVAGSVLVLAGALIGTTRQAKIHTWREFPILWMVLVGFPSDGKSPAMDAVLDPVREIERDDMDHHQDVLARWEAEKAAAVVRAAKWEDEVEIAVKNGVPPPPKPANAVEPEKPPRPRIIMADATTEACASLLAAQPRGMAMVRDELAGWLGGFDRYSGGRGADRAFALECYGGRSSTIDRQSRPPLNIPFAATSILGGVQPDRLAAITDGADDGFASRFLYVWPARAPHARVVAGPDPAQLTRAFRRLRALRHGQSGERLTPVDVALSPAAVEVFENYRARCHRLASGEAGIYGGVLGKSAGTVLRVALTFELLTWAAGDDAATEPEAIKSTAMTQAVEWVEAYAMPMLRRALGEAGLPQAERDAALLARRIAGERPARINARAIRHARWLTGNAPSARYDAALAELVEARWLVRDPSRAGDTKGRPSADYKLANGLMDALEALRLRGEA